MPPIPVTATTPAIEVWKKKIPPSWAVCGCAVCTDGVIHLDDEADCARWATELTNLATWLRERP